MAVVFGEVAEALVRIEPHVLVPTVGDALEVDGAPLESNDSVVSSSNLASRAERNQRVILVRRRLELLQDLKVGIFRVEDRVAAVADNGDGIVERTHRQRRSAARTVQCTGLCL